MSDIVFACLLVTLEKLVGMVSNPSTKRGLRPGQVIINRWEEQMLITRKDTIANFVEINNSFDGLAR